MREGEREGRIVDISRLVLVRQIKETIILGTKTKGRLRGFPQSNVPRGIQKCRSHSYWFGRRAYFGGKGLANRIELSEIKRPSAADRSGGARGERKKIPALKNRVKKKEDPERQLGQSEVGSGGKPGETQGPLF